MASHAVKMSEASGDQRDHVAAVEPLVLGELWVHSAVVCIRRQVALFTRC